MENEDIGYLIASLQDMITFNRVKVAYTSGSGNVKAIIVHQIGITDAVKIETYPKVINEDYMIFYLFIWSRSEVKNS